MFISGSPLRGLYRDLEGIYRKNVVWGFRVRGFWVEDLAPSPCGGVLLQSCNFHQKFIAEFEV